ncbi:MAG: hypothetical protein HOP12_05370 [Candidatus Eisenbacteria bacterium]|uniref:Uncharacterized protein n=1 Tax=Eiseniibacteriota bacterium TaxID=2212470 RepID=A0A849SGE2_UNCEI|nr:hypothetical protein [Candidatus Eisenbacteria bacterium]
MTKPSRPTEISDEAPPALERHALENLRYIRRTMEGAGAFTAASGVGQVAIGATALVATWLAMRQPNRAAWFGVWLAEAGIAVAIALIAMVIKARRSNVPLASEPARRFAASFAWPMLAGVALTAAFARSRAFEFMTPSWLLLFGAAVAAGGTFSVRPVRLMGMAFLILGLASLVAGPALDHWMLAIGFGGLLLGFGVHIAWRHGG